MNRFKKELKNRGYRLESDYEYLPFDGIETVKVNAEKATFSIYHVSAGWTVIEFDKRMNANTRFID